MLWQLKILELKYLGLPRFLEKANPDFANSDQCALPRTAYLREASGGAVGAGDGIANGTGNSAHVKAVHGTEGGCA